jgi:hypothetical protein
MRKTITIAAGGLRAEIVPSLGGGLAHFDMLGASPHISNYLKTSGRRISESCCVAITFERFEERPDADRV